MKTLYSTLILFFLFSVPIWGQEKIVEDTLINEVKSVSINEDAFLDHTSPDLSVRSPHADLSLPRADSLIHYPIQRPFYIPLYHASSIPLSYGDYNSSGRLYGNIYGSGAQYTLPGIGRLNQVSFAYQRQIGSHFNLQIGLNATKYYFQYATGQTFGAFGSFVYSPTDRLHLQFFGAYGVKNAYNFNNTYYGGTIGYDFNERFGMDIGVQRFYDPQHGWQTVPIATPYYKFRKCKIGVDVGGLLYYFLQNRK